MPYIAYRSTNFRGDTMDVIRQAETICADYASQGFDLTLRQLYYQFVARGLLSNEQKSYNRLGTIINDARMAGMLDWDYITDRTRNLESNNHYRDPAQILDIASRSYQIDKWEDQPLRIEVWVEKEALAGVIAQAADPLDCAYFSCRGYPSQSEMWAAGQRIYRYVKGDQKVIILHLGDHDPSGIDMTRDIKDRIRTFAGSHLVADGFISGRDEYEEVVEVRRIALTYAQVQQYQPPPNPAKMTDARAKGYVREFGYQSWELDALDPATLTTLVQDEIVAERDAHAWNASVARESRERMQLARVASGWEEIVEDLEEDS